MASHCDFTEEGIRPRSGIFSAPPCSGRFCPMFAGSVTPMLSRMMDAVAGHDIEKVRRISKLGIAVAVGGALLQLLLGLYYLAMAHSPHPHELPVGFVGSAAQKAQLATPLEKDGQFKVASYADAASLQRAIRHRKAYGGVVFNGNTPTLYVASAAAPSVANLLRATYTGEYQQYIAKQVSQLTAAGQPVPAGTAATLATPPAMVDVVPL